MGHFGRSTNIASPVLKTLPTSMTFHWTDFKRDHRVRLVVNGKDATFYKPDDTEVNIVLHFDAAELNATLKQLSPNKAMILLALDLQERDYGAELIVSLKADGKKIILNKLTFESE
jgi:hypothetical protein